MVSLVYGEVTSVLIAVPAVVGGLEQWSARAQMSPAGVYSWDVLRTVHRRTLQGPVAKTLDVIFRYPNVLAISALECCAGFLVLISLGKGTIVPLAIGVLLLCHLANNLRYQIGLDGSDQMRTVVLAGLTVFYLSPSEAGRAIGLGFIAAQSLLSYFTSGVAKAISPQWRGGTAVADILATKSYGDRSLAKLTGRSRVISHVACIATIIFECLFPLILLVGPVGAIAFIVMGILFHTSIAFAMGLNSFLWAFVATYPALLFVSVSLHL